MDYKQLWQVAKYADNRIAASKVALDDYISTENMLPDKGGVTLATSLPEVKTHPKFVEGDILLSNIRPYSKKIWFADRTGGCSNDVLVVKATDVQPKFLYYVLSDNNFFNYSTVTSKGTKMPRGSKPAIMKYLLLTSPSMQDAFQAQTNGASQQFIGLAFVRRFKIVVPNEALLEDFSKHVLPLINKRRILHKKSQNPVKQRDMLLPRLMSGKLEV